MSQMADVVAPRGGVRRAINRFFLRLPSRVYRLLGQTEVPHNLGGAPMGQSAAEGVADHVGRVHGLRRPVPGRCLGAPPGHGRNSVATIAALAERSMAHVLFPEHRGALEQRIERLLEGLSAETGADALRTEVLRRVEEEQERLAAEPAVDEPREELWRHVLAALRARAAGAGDGSAAPRTGAQELLQRLRETIAKLGPEGLEPA